MMVLFFRLKTATITAYVFFSLPPSLTFKIGGSALLFDPPTLPAIFPCHRGCKKQHCKTPPTFGILISPATRLGIIKMCLRADISLVAARRTLSVRNASGEEINPSTQYADTNRSSVNVPCLCATLCGIAFFFFFFFLLDFSILSLQLAIPDGEPHWSWAANFTVRYFTNKPHRFSHSKKMQ